MSLDPMAALKKLASLHAKCESAMQAASSSIPTVPIMPAGTPTPLYTVVKHRDCEWNTLLAGGLLVRTAVTLQTSDAPLAEFNFGLVLHDAAGQAARLVHLKTLFMDHLGNLRVRADDSIAHENVGEPSWYASVLKSLIHDSQRISAAWARRCEFVVPSGK